MSTVDAMEVVVFPNGFRLDSRKYDKVILTLPQVVLGSQSRLEKVFECLWGWGPTNTQRLFSESLESSFSIRKGVIIEYLR
jgi:hypothetical protein